MCGIFQLCVFSFWIKTIWWPLYYLSLMSINASVAFFTTSIPKNWVVLSIVNLTASYTESAHLCRTVPLYNIAMPFSLMIYDDKNLTEVLQRSSWTCHSSSNISAGRQVRAEVANISLQSVAGGLITKPCSSLFDCLFDRVTVWNLSCECMIVHVP